MLSQGPFQPDFFYDSMTTFFQVRGVEKPNLECPDCQVTDPFSWLFSSWCIW